MYLYGIIFNLLAYTSTNHSAGTIYDTSAGQFYVVFRGCVNLYGSDSLERTSSGIQIFERYFFWLQKSELDNYFMIKLFVQSN